MKKLLFKILIILSCLFFAHTTTLRIHVYYDKATAPSLLQMIHLIKQPQKDYKIVLWERFYKHMKNKQNYPNTLFPSNWDNLFKTVDKLIKEHPNAKIVLHHNLHHEYFFNAFIKRYPKQLILESHAYEDASGYVYWSKGRNYIFYNNPDINHILHLWGDVEKLCEKNELSNCNEVKKLVQNVKIEPIDYEKIAKTLTQEEIEKIADLTGIDLKKLKQQLGDKKNGIYVLGCVAGTNIDVLQLTALKDVCTQTKDISWYYKPHPSLRKTPSEKVLNSLCPNIKPIDAHLPFELLILTRLQPTYVAGIGSSLFFNLNGQNILKYIQRWNLDFYIPTLKKAGILISDEQLITLEQAKQKFNELNFIYLENNGWFIKVENEYCRMHSNECYKIISDNNQEKTVQNNKGEHLKSTFLKDYIWSNFEIVNE